MVDIAEPHDGATYRIDEEVVLRARAMPRGSPVTRLAFNINGVLSPDATFQDGELPGYSLHWKPMQKGEFTVQAIAWDGSARQGQSKPQIIRVDDVGEPAMRIEWATPAEGETLPLDSAVTLSIVAYTHRPGSISNLSGSTTASSPSAQLQALMGVPTLPLGFRRCQASTLSPRSP